MRVEVRAHRGSQRLDGCDFTDGKASRSRGGGCCEITEKHKPVDSLAVLVISLVSGAVFLVGASLLTTSLGGN